MLTGRRADKRGVEDFTTFNHIIAKYGVIVDCEIIINTEGKCWPGTGKDGKQCQNHYH